MPPRAAGYAGRMTATGADGVCRDYWSNGRLASEERLVNGSPEGEWRFYDRDGALREVIRFEAGREVIDWNALLGRPPRRMEPPR